MRIERKMTRGGKYVPRLILDDTAGVTATQDRGCVLYREAENGEVYAVTIPPAEAAKIARMARHYGWEA